MKHLHERIAPSKATSLQIMWHNSSGVVIGILVFFIGLTLITSFATRIGHVQRQVETLVSADRDQGLWTATQIQVELLEFEKLIQAAKSSPTTFENDIRTDFDILYSRLSQVLEPNIAIAFRDNDVFTIPVEIINARDQMAKIIDLNETLGLRELDELISLTTSAYYQWKQSVGLVLQETREYKVSIRQQAVDTLQSVQMKLWIAVVIAIALQVLTMLLLLLRVKYREARSDNLKDSLTGCASREGLQYALLNDFNKTKCGFSVAIADINNLKLINDQFGHKTGDRVIQSVGIALNKVTRGIDCTARVGGDEFILLLDASVEQAELILKRAQEHLDMMSNEEYLSKIDLCISFGVAHCPDPSQFDDAITLADERMYHQKHAKKINKHPIIDLTMNDRIA